MTTGFVLQIISGRLWLLRPRVVRVWRNRKPEQKRKEGGTLLHQVEMMRIVTPNGGGRASSRSNQGGGIHHQRRPSRKRERQTEEGGSGWEPGVKRSILHPAAKRHCTRETTYLPTDRKGDRSAGRADPVLGLLVVKSWLTLPAAIDFCPPPNQRRDNRKPPPVALLTRPATQCVLQAISVSILIGRRSVDSRNWWKLAEVHRPVPESLIGRCPWQTTAALSKWPELKNSICCSPSQSNRRLVRLETK